MRLLIFIFALYGVNFCFSQKSPIAFRDSIRAKPDSLYREDQFYLCFTANLLKEMPVDFSRQGISLGTSFGFIRDFPINKKRTIAIAPGIGFGYNRYNQNLYISVQDQKPVYRLAEGSPSASNRFNQYLLELPLEFRWRNSSPTRYNFFRVYAGLKASYLFYDKSVSADSRSVILVNNPDFNNFLYGTYLSVGYNTWNFYVYYSLNPIFRSGQIDSTSENLGGKTLNMGLIFYFL